MQQCFNTPFSIGSLSLPHRLIQGPLAGVSCAPFRQLFSLYTPAAYAVSEMLSAYDVVHKHQAAGRYLYRDPSEARLCYQLAGRDPGIMAAAAVKLEALGADLIDINCGCPKSKIRKKGAGSALLEHPQDLFSLLTAVRRAIRCPLTVKIRLQGGQQDLDLAKQIAAVGVDALIVHGRRWVEGYDRPCDLQQIAAIKQAIQIPVIANGDMRDGESLEKTRSQTGCDGYMISRASTGRPWLFQSLLEGSTPDIDLSIRLKHFMRHLTGLATLENEVQAVLQSKSLVRYYFRDWVDEDFLKAFYALSSLNDIERQLKGCIIKFA